MTGGLRAKGVSFQEFLMEKSFDPDLSIDLYFTRGQSLCLFVFLQKIYKLVINVRWNGKSFPYSNYKTTLGRYGQSAIDRLRVRTNLYQAVHSARSYCDSFRISINLFYFKLNFICTGQLSDVFFSFVKQNKSIL